MGGYEAGQGDKDGEEVPAAVLRSLALLCWGRNLFQELGQLGTNSNTSVNYLPVCATQMTAHSCVEDDFF